VLLERSKEYNSLVFETEALFRLMCEHEKRRHAKRRTEKCL
jgi:hypothetical protein